MFGKIELAQFEGLTKMPQKAASAWSGAGNELKTKGFVGASYKPLLYCGSKVVRGINHVFIAEQTLITNPPVRRLVIMEINEFNGVYEIVPSSIVGIFD